MNQHPVWWFKVKGGEWWPCRLGGHKWERYAEQPPESNITRVYARCSRCGKKYP